MARFLVPFLIVLSLAFSAPAVGQCPSSSNAIAAENCLPGAPPSQWDITGAGDPAIQGYATDISVNKGGIVHFKVNTPATSYRLDIYRLGYYGGNGARLVDSVLPSATLPQLQPDCLTNADTNLVDCGNWTESASWAVPAEAVSGVYLAKLVRTDGVSGASHVIFIVRDDSSTSALLFQTSDTTWQAYNNYGGSQMDSGATGLAAKVSYNRPFTTRETDGGFDWIFNAEYPMIRWLEANGYDVTYFTDTDSDRRGGLIQRHKVFLSVGHDEYWSGAQRANVEAARTAGVHLAFFSANEMYRKTRWEMSIDGSGTPYRTLVCYNDSYRTSPMDPAFPPVWTGLWRDPRFSPPGDGGKPENALSGTIFMVNGTRTDSVQVPAADGKMRFWRNSAAASLAPNGVYATPAGTLGFEWNEDLDNGSRPQGLVRLSTSTYDVPGKFLDYVVYGPGTATHHATMYKAQSGAIVFSAGTVQWPWGLDSTHDISIVPTDVAMKQATVNLFADMGAQPATLQAGLVAAEASTDTVAPTSVITSPQSGASVGAGSAITVTGTASDSGGVVGAVEVSIDGGATWHPADGRENWTYTGVVGISSTTATIMSRAVDDSLNIETPTSTVTVDVIGATPGILSMWPPSTLPQVASNEDSNPIEVGVKFRSDSDGYISAIRFYKGIGNTGTHIGSIWTTSGTKLASAVFTSETASGWQQVDLAEPVAITANSTYIASYHTDTGHYSSSAGFFANNGIDNPPLHFPQDGAYGGNGVFKYTPASAFPDGSYNSENYWVDVLFSQTPPAPRPPAVALTTPVNGAQGVSTSTALTAQFNKTIDPATLTNSTFQLLDSNHNPVAGSVSYSDTNNAGIFTPSAALAYSSTYTAVIKSGTNGVHDPAGTPMIGDYTWSFKTAAAPPPSPESGPGGPILVVASDSNPFSKYFAEILRAEGLNEFAIADISTVTPAILTAYDVVVMGQIGLSDEQVAMFTDWVNGGGKLIAMRPDKKLASLFGLVDANGVQSDKYLLVNTTSGPGRGITAQTLQYHSDADLYTANGATVLATLYSDANTSTTSPAVTLNAVGTNGGMAAAFTYDLARSVIYTRQGNPAWTGQKRDGQSGPIRSDDAFYGPAAADPQPDYVDFNKIAIPQADEQQRLLANMILSMNLARKPLPRFSYLPRNIKAAVVMTGDDHGGGGTVGRFAKYVASSPQNCSVDNWECIRATSYTVPVTLMTNQQAAPYVEMGFEVALHADTECSDFSYTSLQNYFTSQLEDWQGVFPTLPPPVTNRTHCIPWSDWMSQPKVELSKGIRADTNYYYWPDAWVQNRPGFFTGSGMPMRFADLNGSMVDVYQLTTQMTDESRQTYPFTIDALLDNALGSNAYYGVFTANAHTDNAESPESDAIIASAQAHGVPVVSARQMLTWLDGRNNSSFGSFSWDGRHLQFTVSTWTGSNGLTALLPMSSAAGPLDSINVNGTPVSFTSETIKGGQYAVFPAASGTYLAVYKAPPVAPTNLVATAASQTAVNLSWSVNSDNHTGFHILRATTGGTATEIASVDANATSYTDTTAVAFTHYTYQVAAYNEIGSSLSNTAEVTTPDNPPAAPSAVQATANWATNVTITWTDNSSNETGFTIDRATTSAFDEEFATFAVNANVTIYTDSSVQPSTTYFYRVRGSNSGGNSQNSNTATVTTPQMVPAARPVFTPAAIQPYNTPQNVTITSATPGATIYFTLDGSTPTTASPVYSAPITITQNTTLKAMAAAPGYLNSPVLTGGYTILAARPVFTPAAIQPYTTPQTVTITSATPGAAIYYTLDGSTPTAASTPYSEPITISKNTTLKAVAIASGLGNSQVLTGGYVISAGAPVFSPSPIQPFVGTQTVTLMSSTPGAAIYYTLDGSTPTTASTLYTGALSLASTTTVKAFSMASGYGNSVVVTGTFSITPKTATPVFSVAPGSYTSIQNLVISTTTPGASIYYTLNGTIPTTSSTLYTGPITLNKNTTVRAIAVHAGYANSEIASGDYVITLTAATPTFTPAAVQAYGSPQNVTIASATPGAAIFYTLDGSTPTASSTPYSGSISISKNTTLKAIAVATGYLNSAVYTGTYVILAARPIFTPAAIQPYGSPQNITMTTATPGATIYYTLDGSTPTAASTPYTEPVTISQNTTVKAIAIAPGLGNSPILTGGYTILAARPVFTPAAVQPYTGPQTITMTSATPGATIYYTLDGSTPTAASTLYTTPITITQSTTVKAIAIAPGFGNSPVLTGGYTIR